MPVPKSKEALYGKIVGHQINLMKQKGTYKKGAGLRKAKDITDRALKLKKSKTKKKKT
jgi:hypothetical protein